MKSKQKLFNKMALGLFCCLSVPAYSANRGFVDGDFGSYTKASTGQGQTYNGYFPNGEHGWKSTYPQGIEIWSRYLGITGARNADSNEAGGQYSVLRKGNAGVLYQNMCFIEPNEPMFYRFAHRALSSNFTNDGLTPKPAGETVVFGVFDENSQLKMNIPNPGFSANEPNGVAVNLAPSTNWTSTADKWSYYPPRYEGTSWPDPSYTQPILFRTFTTPYTGPLGKYRVGFQSVDANNSLGNLIDSVYVGLKPAIDLGPNRIIEQKGGDRLFIPIRLNGVLPVNENGVGFGGTIFLKDTGTIPRDMYTLDQPRWGSADWFSGNTGGNPISVSWSEPNKGWYIYFGEKSRRIFDGDDPDTYMYIPVVLKQHGDWKVSFELAQPGEFGTADASRWIIGGTPKTNPICEGESHLSIELKPSDSIDQWYSDVSNVYSTPNVTPTTVSLSTHFNVMKSIGDVRATKLDDDTGVVGPKAERVWSAAEKLNARDWKTRKIYTTNKPFFDSSNKQAAVELEWSTLDTDLTQNDVTEYGTVSLDSDSKRLDYFKGDRSNEGTGSYPRRSSLLGEVHSGIVVHKNLVYVQSGEGMLHAFNLATGEEEWAYVPKGGVRPVNLLQRLPYGLPPEATTLSGKLLFPEDDLAPLNVGKIALVKVGKELVLLGTTGGLYRAETTQTTRQPIFYALTIEDANGNVSDRPVPRWANRGPCDSSLNTTIPNCGQKPIVENWKIGHLADGPDQVVGFIPSGIVQTDKAKPALVNGKVDSAYQQPVQSSAHVLNVFSVDTGKYTLIYSQRKYSGYNADQAPYGQGHLIALFEKFKRTTFTDVDFAYGSQPLVNYPEQKEMTDIYVGDGIGYIWRLNVKGLTFNDLYVPPNYQKSSSFNYNTNTYYDSIYNFTPTFMGDKPIYRIKVGEEEIERGGISGAEKGRMILFGTSGNQGIRALKEPFQNTGVNVIAGYFSPSAYNPVTPVITSYADLVPQVRKATDADQKAVYTELTPIDYSIKKGWMMELKDPLSGEDKQEQVLAAPYLYDKTSALFFTAVPNYSNHEMTNVPYGYFMKVNIMTGQIEPEVAGATPPNRIDGVFAAPSIIKNDKTGKTHFNIKYASAEPESESKVGSIIRDTGIDPDPCNKTTQVCSKTKTLSRLSVRELLAD